MYVKTIQNNQRQSGQAGLQTLPANEDFVDFLHRVSTARQRARLFPWPLLGWVALLMAFFFAGKLLRSWDDTAAVADVGVLSLLLLAVIGGLLTVQLAGLLCNRLFSRLAGFGPQQFTETFIRLTAWKQISFYLACYLSFFWGFLAVVCTVL